jgi:hypothetical protein
MTNKTKRSWKAFWKSRGIQYKKRMNKGQLRSLLEKDDVEHPDAAREDGVIQNEYLEAADAMLDTP